MTHHVLLPRSSRTTIILRSETIDLPNELERVRCILNEMHGSFTILIMRVTPLPDHQTEFVYLCIGNNLISSLLAHDVKQCFFYVSMDLDAEVDIRDDPPSDGELGTRDSKGILSPSRSELFVV